MCKIRKDLSISDKDKEIMTINIISTVIKESKNMLFFSCYKSTKGIMENITAHLSSTFQSLQNEKKVL